jgi:suppressor for copper-sensitivity B
MRHIKPLPGIFYGLTGILLCLSATALAQPLSGLPGRFGGQSSFGGGKGILGVGDRVATVEAGFTTPAADGSSQLFVAVTLPEGANTYSVTQPEPGTGHPTRTLIKVRPNDSVPTIGKFQSVERPKMILNGQFRCVQEEHFGTVKWVAPIQFAAGVKPDSLKIEGNVYMQLCDKSGCVAPKDFPFTAELQADAKPEKPAEAPPPSPAAPSPQSGVGGSVAQVAEPSTKKGDLTWRHFTTVAALRDLVGPKLDVEQVKAYVAHSDSDLSVSRAILFGFLGGLILNIMPCVLPVIGLKILSFVEQSGHNRRRALMLNVWYSAGLMSVFVILATLAVGPQRLGWGQLFGETWFTISLTAVVFVMALSFMGVWEVPMPTFLGRGKARELASQEGAVGAFFKGGITTLLATPCSAPYLAPALVWAAAQPAWLTYLVFLSIGFGLASPYLLIGAFPELLKFLPKPGAWMETFKQFMGFVLIGTVVYLLTVLEPYNVIPTVGFLFGLWFLCWLIGGMSPLAGLGVKLRSWCIGIAVCSIVWIGMYRGIDSKVLGRFSFPGISAIMQERLGMDEDAVDDGPPLVGPKTVLVDFTADWCGTCKFYESNYLRTEPVIDAIHRLGVVTLKADWTHRERSLEVTRMLDVLGGRQIPVLAVFSADHPNSPTVIRGGYTQQDVLEALEKAGPSPPAGLALK